MIRSVTVENDLGEVLEMELARPESSGFAVINVDGLGPPPATINSSPVSLFDGERFNSARVGTRNIVLTLVFKDTPTIEDTRYLSYKTFPIKRKIKLTVATGRRIGVIEGWVESNEPSIFSPMQSAIVSVLCPQPYFRDGSADESRSVSFYGVTPKFTFPFMNNHATNKLLIMGEFEDITTRDLFYDGDVDAGVIFDMTFTGNTQNLTMHNPITGSGITINHFRLTQVAGTGLGAGDRVVIDTRQGSRSAFLYRGSSKINIIHALGTSISWLELRRGDNQISVEAGTGIQNARVLMTYDKLYEGV